MPRILMKEGTDTATPPSEYVAQYAKADGLMYWKDDAGNEYSMNATGAVSDTAYAGSWNGVTTIAPSKNAVYDKIETIAGAVVSDTAYGVGWNGDTTVAPSKNAVYDKVEAVIATIPVVSDTVYGSGWNGDTTGAASKNAIYDKVEAVIALIVSTFSDSAFRVQDNGDPTKQIALEASTITAGQTRTITMPDRNVDLAKATRVALCFSLGGSTTDMVTGTAVETFRMPFAMTLTSVKATVTTAPTGATAIFDIKESGTTILSTKISIDIGEKTSATAAAPPVISDTALADDAEITFNIDQIGSTIAGAGPKVWLIGYEA